MLAARPARCSCCQRLLAPALPLLIRLPAALQAPAQPCACVGVHRALLMCKAHAEGWPVQVNAANLVKDLPSNLRFLVSGGSRQSDTPHRRPLVQVCPSSVSSAKMQGWCCPLQRPGVGELVTMPCPAASSACSHPCPSSWLCSAPWRSRWQSRRGLCSACTGNACKAGPCPTGQMFRPSAGAHRLPAQSCKPGGCPTGLQARPLTRLSGRRRAQTARSELPPHTEDGQRDSLEQPLLRQKSSS